MILISQQDQKLCKMSFKDLDPRLYDCKREDLSALEESYLDVLGSSDQSVP